MLKKILHTRPIIFLAEDDEDDAFFMKTALNDVDPQVELIHFSNGKDLINSLNDENSELPLFIMLDLRMPVLGGIEALNIIRKEISVDLPVIILTTITHQAIKEACLKEGANQYFTKPYSYHRYVEMLHELKNTYYHPEQV